MPRKCPAAFLASIILPHHEVAGVPKSEICPGAVATYDVITGRTAAVRCLTDLAAAMAGRGAELHPSG